MDYIVVGSRQKANYRIVREFLDKLTDIDTIISGGAQGTDLHAKIYAKRNNIEYIEYPAEWDIYGRSAGWERNNQMAEENQHATIIAFYNGYSKGTAHWFTISKQFKMELVIVDL
jgi:hypothetical protein